MNPRWRVAEVVAVAIPMALVAYAWGPTWRTVVAEGVLLVSTWIGDRISRSWFARRQSKPRM